MWSRSQKRTYVAVLKFNARVCDRSSVYSKNDWLARRNIHFLRIQIQRIEH